MTTAYFFKPVKSIKLKGDKNISALTTAKVKLLKEKVTT